MARNVYMLSNQISKKASFSALQVALQDSVPELYAQKTCSFSYQLELDALCIVFRSGQIVLLDPSNNCTEEASRDCTSVHAALAHLFLAYCLR